MDLPELTILPAGPDDAEACAALFRTDARDWETAEQRAERCHREFQDIADGTRVVLFAHLSGAIVGSAQLALNTPTPGDGLVQSVIVHPDHRRAGIARALMQAAEDLARTRGLRRILLDVHPENAPALALYDALGFTDAPGETAIFHECTRRHKPLTP